MSAHVNNRWVAAFFFILAIALCAPASAAVDAERPFEVKVQTAVPPYTFSCGDGLYSTVSGYLQIKDAKVAKAEKFEIVVPGFAKPMPVVATIQSHPAPLVVVLLGISSRADTDFSQLWPSWFASAGYHVLTMNSTFRAEFMDISGKGVSGNIWSESESVAQIIDAFLHLSTVRDRVTKIGIVGMSYGGIEALILGQMAGERRLPFEIASIQAFSPPLKMDRTAELFDDWYNENRWKFTQIEMWRKVDGHKPQCHTECRPLSEEILKASISLSFQVELIPVVIRANDKYDLKVLPEGDFFTGREVKEDYAATWGFSKYAYDLALPWWKEKLNLSNLDELITSSYLCNLAAKQPAYSEIILTADDPFNDAADLAEFRACKYTGRLQILPQGGHLGYIGDEWTRAKLLSLFSEIPLEQLTTVSHDVEQTR